MITLKSISGRNLAVISFVLSGLFVTPSFSKASVTINYEVAEITSAGTNISSGTLFFISHGVDNIFQSTGWANNTTSFILGDDVLFGAVPIVNGVAAGALADFALPANTTANTTKLTGLFVAGLTSSRVNYTTGALKAVAIGSEPNVQLTFNNNLSLPNAISYNFGTYRNDGAEAFGGSTAGKIGWIFPADGATVDLFSYSNTGDYTGATITAVLATSSNFVIIPEPSISSMLFLALGGFGLNTIRRRIK